MGIGYAVLGIPSLTSATNSGFTLPPFDAFGSVAETFATFNAGGGLLRISSTGVTGFITDVELSLPIFEAEGVGYTGETGSVSETLNALADGMLYPFMSLAAAGQGLSGEVAATLPSVELYAEGSLVKTITATITLPSYTLLGNNLGVAVGENNFPRPSVTGAGFTGQIGTLAVSLKIPSVAGQLLHPGSSVSDLTLPIFTSSGILQHGLVAVIDASLPLFEVSISGLSGHIGSASLTLSVPTLNALSYVSATGTAGLTIPVITLDAGVLVNLVNTILNVYVFNTQHYAASQYTNFGFNSFCTFNDSQLAASPNGLFLLGGDEDYSDTQIEMKLSKEDLLGSNKNQKKMSEALVDVKTNSSLSFSVTAEGEESRYVAYPHYGDNKHQTIRVKTGKGITGKYIDICLRNVGGGDMYIDNVVIPIDFLQRTGRR